MSASFSEPPPAPETERRSTSEPPSGSAPVPAAPAIRQAIEEILRINKDLEWVLLEMEKALETLEEAEVQKYADEREIESLRNAVRQIGRTREGIQQRVQQSGGQRRPEDSRRGRHSNREHREHRGDHREHRERRDQRHQSHHQSEHHHEHSEAHEANPGREHENRPEPPSEPEIPV